MVLSKEVLSRPLFTPHALRPVGGVWGEAFILWMDDGFSFRTTFQNPGNDSIPLQLPTTLWLRQWIHFVQLFT